MPLTVGADPFRNIPVLIDIIGNADSPLRAQVWRAECLKSFLVEGGADLNGLDASWLDAQLCGVAAHKRQSECCEQSKGNRQRRYELPKPRHILSFLEGGLAVSGGRSHQATNRLG